ncbi:sigma-54 dependent transcriptional regulator [Candidatus Halobeggiatoa sp. HSG11]|nr:sigma-54 dependent transcriptional regulator [Candidatus Halobeggiatoa sp. HSG11]
MNKPSILLIEDDVVSAEMYKDYLNNEPINLIHLKTVAQSMAYLQKSVAVAVILLDLGLPDSNGMKILEYVKQQMLDIKVIVITMENSVEVVVEAMHYGAFDFIEKPIQKERLIIALRNALCNMSQSVDCHNFKTTRKQYHEIIGASLSMQTVYYRIDKIAKSNASVLITGETGTGKELCALAIHKESYRKNEPFITINCATIPKDLMESEIFGYVQGAFTGAIKNRQGAAHSANHGTLFLDEIGDMDIMLQSKLLRFIQEGTFYKLGKDIQEKVDIRFICATHRDLPSEIKINKFREDLYHRLNVIPINLPPLRERKQDILLLAQYFLQKYTEREQKKLQSFTKSAKKFLLEHEWNGNIRELQNTIERIVLLSDEQSITSDILLSNIGGESYISTNSKPQPISYSNQQIRPLEEVEKEAILEAIKFCHGNVVLAARLLKVSKATIYRRLNKWDIPHKLEDFLQLEHPDFKK